jgi:hypothetical protein
MEWLVAREFQVRAIIVANPMASWFETGGVAALLTMRVYGTSS